MNAAYNSNYIMGQSLINKKTCVYFLDEMSLSVARKVNLSRLKIKTASIFSTFSTLGWIRSILRALQLSTFGNPIQLLWIPLAVL